MLYFIFALPLLVPGILLIVISVRKLPKEKFKYDWNAPSGGIGFIPWRYTRLPTGIILTMLGVFIVIAPHSFFFAHLVFWPGIILSIAIDLAYYPSFARWQDWLFEKLAGKDKTDDQNDADDTKEKEKDT